MAGQPVDHLLQQTRSHEAEVCHPCLVVPCPPAIIHVTISNLAAALPVLKPSQEAGL